MTRKDPYRRWRNAERRASRPLPFRAPWWVRAIVLVFIIGGTSAALVTGVKVYAWVIIPCGWIVGVVLQNPPYRAAVWRVIVRAARNRYVWIVAAGLLFATLAATVAVLFGGHEQLPMDPDTPSTVTTIGGDGR